MHDIVVVPLGTVSPYCKGDKNCPGFLVKVDGKKILLDCGSGILRYLNMKEDLNDLIVIISHLHKDHYADLLSLGYASYVYHKLGYLENKIDVYIPYSDEVIKRETYVGEDGWASYKNVKTLLPDYTFLQNFGNENYLNFINYDEDTYLNFDKINISFYKTLHDICNYAVSIECNNQKVCYSGDTGFDISLASFFSKANLLICESTFLKSQEKKGNNHLYAYESAELAIKSDVDKLLLTHFWPEIDKELYKEEAIKKFLNTDIAIEGKEILVRRRRI